jgi:hypothetical protein
VRIRWYLWAGLGDDGGWNQSNVLLSAGRFDAVRGTVFAGRIPQSGSFWKNNTALLRVQNMLS